MNKYQILVLFPYAIIITFSVIKSFTILSEYSIYGTIFQGLVDWPYDYLDSEWRVTINNSQNFYFITFIPFLSLINRRIFLPLLGILMIVYLSKYGIFVYLTLVISNYFINKKYREFRFYYQLTWIGHLTILIIMNQVHNYQKYQEIIPLNHYYLWTLLRMISFNFDDNGNSTLQNYLYYILYPPLLYSGPLITYNQFTTLPQIRKFRYSFFYFGVLLFILSVTCAAYAFSNHELNLQYWQKYIDPFSGFSMLISSLIQVYCKYMYLWAVQECWASLDGLQVQSNYGDHLFMINSPQNFSRYFCCTLRQFYIEYIINAFTISNKLITFSIIYIIQIILFNSDSSLLCFWTIQFILQFSIIQCKVNYILLKIFINSIIQLIMIYSAIIVFAVDWKIFEYYMSQYSPYHIAIINETSLSIELVLHHIQQYHFPIKDPESYQPLSLSNTENFIIQKSQHSLYYGQLQQEVRQGIGVLIKSKSIYEGEFQQNLKQGKGIEMFMNGAFYEGDFKNNKPEGMGKFNWNNGETYEGEWVEGLKEGSGIWRGMKGDSYIGEWKKGMAEGYGVHAWVNGDRYEGQFKNCLKEGQGTEKFANGDLYIGQYAKGKPQGSGQYYWANGSHYRGQFQNGLRHGKGTWRRNSGLSDHYEGDYRDDLKCGRGVFVWADGNRYEGEFNNDVREGNGVMHWGDGSYYSGQWKGGIQDGEGILVQGQELIKGIFYGNKLLQIYEHEQQPLKHQKSITEQSTKQDSFTQTVRLYTPNKKMRLLQLVHKPPKSVSPRFKIQYKQQNTQRKCWLPTGAVKRKK